MNNLDDVRVFARLADDATGDDHRFVTNAKASHFSELLCNDRPPHQATLFRWETRGVRGIKLESWLIGGKRVTTRAAVRRFLAALSAQSAGVPAPASAEARAAHVQAEHELARMGV